MKSFFDRYMISIFTAGVLLLGVGSSSVSYANDRPVHHSQREAEATPKTSADASGRPMHPQEAAGQAAQVVQPKVQVPQVVVPRVETPQVVQPKVEKPEIKGPEPKEQSDTDKVDTPAETKSSVTIEKVERRKDGTSREPLIAPDQTMARVVLSRQAGSEGIEALKELLAKDAVMKVVDALELGGEKFNSMEEILKDYKRYIIAIHISDGIDARPGETFSAKIDVNVKKLRSLAEKHPAPHKKEKHAYTIA